MEKFSLDTWLKDKSRKVVTRDGRNVRIICWDIKSNTPIIAAIQWNDEREDCYFYNTIGRCANNVAEIDLFFADEDDEFKTTMISFSHAMFDHLLDTNVKVDIKEWKNKLLDLARKEILKSFPMWKKITEVKQNYLAYGYLSHDGYYLSIQELKDELPKEE